MNHKIGDEVFYEWTKCRIVRMDGDRIVELKGETFSTSAYDFSIEIFSIDEKGTALSERMQRLYDAIYNEGGTLGLNYPDVKRHFVRLWSISMSDRNLDKTIDELFAPMEEFGNHLVDAIKNAKRQTVDGIKLFRQ